MTRFVRAQIASKARHGRLEAAAFAHSRWGLSLDKAKLLAFHIANAGGTCLRCQTALAGEIAICPRCAALNLNG